MKILRSLSLTLAALGCIFTSRAATVTEIEGNDSLGAAQDVSGFFSTGANSLIGSQWGIDPATTPWVSITSNGGNTYDYYSFTTSSTGTISLDIDFGQNQGGSVDTEIGLWRNLGGGSFLLIGSNDDNNITWGTGFNSSSDPGTIHAYDPGIRFLNMTAGSYVVGVGEYNTGFSNTGMSGNVLDSADTYTLHITANGANVPDSGATIALVGLSLVGFLAGRRKRA